MSLHCRKKKYKVVIETHFLQYHKRDLAVYVDLLRAVDRKGRKRIFTLCTFMRAHLSVEATLSNTRYFASGFTAPHSCPDRGAARGEGQTHAPREARGSARHPAQRIDTNRYQMRILFLNSSG